MTRTTKALLTITLVCLAGGLAAVADLIPVPNPAPFYVLLPAAAIVFGLFLISKMLEKETTRYDEEHRANLERAADAEEKEIPPPEKTRPAPSPRRESFARTH